MGIIVVYGVRPSVRLFVRPSVRLNRRYSFNSLRISASYQPKICWDDAQCHGTGRYSKWSRSTNFCVFHGTLKFSMEGFLTRSEGRRCRSYYLRISGITMKLGGVIHSNMKQNAIYSGTFKFSMIGLEQVWGTTSPLELFYDFPLLAWRVVGWCTVTWSTSSFQMAMLGPLFRVPRNFEISRIG